MTRKESLRVLTDWVTSHLSNSPIETQIELYAALGNVLPSIEDRKRATEIAVSLSEVAKLQLDFTRDLFSSIPSLPHDGHHKN